jgi:hypothetical protein
MGLLLLLLWTFCLVYGLCGLAFLISAGVRWIWGLLPEPVNDLPAFTGRIWRLGSDKPKPM